MAATEDSITDLMAEYLRDNGIDARTQISISGPSSRSQPDLQISNGGTFVGESKWEDNKWKGFGEARDYSQLTGVKGAFLISYPNVLKKKGAQSRLGADITESILGDHKYEVAFLRRGEETDMDTLSLEEIPNWINSNISQHKKPKADPEQVVDVLRQAAYTLNKELETAPEENLFRNVLGAEPDEEDEQEAAREAAGFLLVNQITFYRVLSANNPYPDIDIDNLTSPSDLVDYFDRVLDDDYTPVYSFRIAEELPPDSLTILKDAIKSIYALSPERINHDVLGKVFHELIPVSARKKVAAYYTKSKPAEILAELAIDSSNETVLEPACGSGTLLAASYILKKELMDDFTEEDHRRFVEHDLTGIDVMPFAAHLSCIHLALQAPVYETDEVNIGIEDSTTLNPDDTIDQLSFVLPESSRQRGLEDFDSGESVDTSDKQIETGSIAMDAKAGRDMELKLVDTVIMNPPYSRQESIARFSDGYKSDLSNRFSRRNDKGQLHGKMSFCSYFMFLADKFLKSGGTLAAVLPASILTKSSDSGVREMLLQEYNIKYLVARQDKINLSEDTDMREILLVAEKGRQESPVTGYVYLDNLNVEPTEIRTVNTRLDSPPGDGMTEDSGQNFTLRKFPQDSLTPNNLFSPLSIENHGLFNIWYEITNSDKITTIDEKGLDFSRGGSSTPWQNGAIVDPESFKQPSDLWVATEVDEDTVTAKHRKMEKTMDIPRQSVDEYFLRYANKDTLDVSDLQDFTITGDNFDGFENFVKWVDDDEMPDGWKDHIQGTQSSLGLHYRIDLTAPGTRHLAYYTDPKRVFHRMWCVNNLSEKEAKLSSIWFDSSFHLIQMLSSRLPGKGGWTSYQGYLISEFKLIETNKLDEENEDALLSVFNEVSDVEFPSLIEQISRNIDYDLLPEEEKNALEEEYPTAYEKMGDGFEPRKRIDREVLSVIGISENRQDELLKQLYPMLVNELVTLKQMM